LYGERFREMIFTVRKRLEPPVTPAGFAELYLVRRNEHAHTFEVLPSPREI
jgi:hypothetical protein